MNKILCFYLICICVLTGLRADGLSDPAWVSGSLENGLRYFIRQNAKPEERVELRLVVNAGSIQEEEDQQGLAHFLEHSAFNGTRNFEESEMVDFLESIGMTFGPDLNAYTSFDETVYKLKVPTGDPEVVEKSFLILSDWAAGITNLDEALADERGVVIEEWRGRRGADARIRDQQYPVMFAGSRYAERLPIGKLEVLENFDYNRLRDFYRDWYRPDLMSVVVVGNVDVEKARAWIHTYFGGIESPEEVPVREVYVHPPHVDTKVGTFSDPELTRASVALMWKMPPEPIRTEAEYVADIKAILASDMLNQRLFELTQTSPSPFLQAQAYQGGYTRGGDVFYLYAGVKDESGAYVEAAKALLTEAERAKRFGFMQGELDRAIARRLRTLEQSFKEKSNTESADFASEMVRHALTGEYTPGIEKELEVNRRVLEGISLEEVLGVYRTWITDENRVIMAEGPSHDEGTNLPEDEELLALYSEVADLKLEPYVDGVSGQALLDSEPTPGRIVKKDLREDLGLHVYHLSNGITVTLKPTDFKEDQILFSGWRAGGMNLATDEEWLSARLASPVASATGMGNFSTVDLRKRLAGKLAGVQASLSMDQDLLSGGASPDDLETLLQLITLRMGSVRTDEEAFVALKSRLKEGIRNRLADPKAEFGELVTLTMNQHHPRVLPLTLEEVDALDMEKALDYFHRRFQNAYGFEFLFTGKINPDEFEPLMEKWIASLPAEEAEPLANFLDTGFPKEVIRKDLYKGMEPVSQVQMVWTLEEFAWDYDSRHQLQSMVAALRIRLREVVREEEGGSYHVSAWTPMEHYPEPQASLRIAFSCDPERTSDLITRIETLIKEFSSEALEDSYARKVKEGQLRRREQDLKENSFWNYVLPFYDWHQEDPGVVLEFESYVETITSETIRETAEKVFSTPYRAVFVLHPSESKGKSEESP